jgi:uncharacterized protein (TIGR00251 family)
MPDFEINIRLTPKARRNAILGWAENADGKRILKVSVTAIPEKGKANEALIELLAKAWKVPKSAIRIRQGETSRNKTLIFSETPQITI